ncbi:MAG TPA: NADH-quinone oxidoreductase subunit L [Actinomycetaceae bacterium]|nr:NADH-quinone oxidoreductase subunit L [Actinomycetaceae bacterium]
MYPLLLNPAAVAATQATGVASFAWLLVAIPLVSAGLLLVLGRRSDSWGHWFGVAASSGSLVVGIALLAQMLGAAPENRVVTQTLYSWIPAGDLSIDFATRIDPLSMTFIILVTFVGTLIHFYSVAYMEQDPDRRRFFAYMNLFIAAMLLLVIADSYVLMFVGWEGVGLASYLLIGFWNNVPEYATAAKKAFVMNRVGDAGFLLAMGAMFAAVGSVTFDDVLGADLSTFAATLIGLFLLLAAVGKSAQFPLQAWLGDAMAGPTPVSALIHAATMVTAGVYLVVRSGPIYEAAPNAQLVVAIVGAITLIFGAVIGMAKDDLKKVLAASTMSQIGYMMLAAGLGPIGYALAIFHLFTHGFFKANMFLGAGSVMHGMNDQVDMRRFGGLSKYMKITWVTFMMGWLAIMGIPPFAGFFSKDLIIEAAFVGDGWRPWVFGLIALLGAGLTAFYMSRLFFMVFHGEERWTEPPEGPKQDPHESPALMTVPMVVLAFGSVVLGFLMNGWFQTFMEPVTGQVEHAEPVLPVLVIQIATVSLAVVGAAIAYVMYVRRRVPMTAPKGNVLVTAARNDLYQDAVNEALFMRPGMALTRTVDVADDYLVDGVVEGTAFGLKDIGAWLSKLQNGFVRSYASYIVGGVAIAVVAVLFTRM